MSQRNECVESKAMTAKYTVWENDRRPPRSPEYEGRGQGARSPIGLDGPRIGVDPCLDPGSRIGGDNRAT